MQDGSNGTNLDKGRIEIEELIGSAVLCGGFMLHYQPLFETGGRALTGFEALIRLPRKDGTLVLPTVLISAELQRSRAMATARSAVLERRRIA